MIVDPIDLADRLQQLANAKTANGSYVVKKEHRETVIQAEMILRHAFRRSTMTPQEQQREEREQRERKDRERND
jgi:hypothetical protein